MPARNVTNISTSRRPKPIPVIHFIPPRFALIYKIEIVTDTETIDVTESLVEGDYFDGVTDSIGGFSFRFLDPDNTLSNKVEEFDTLNIYMDYGTEAITKRFVGKIEKKSNSDQMYFDITGRSIAMITTGINVTYNSGGSKSRSTILTEIIDKYFTGTISTAGIESDTGTISVNYFEIPFWEVVEEICNSGTRDAYVDPDSVFNYFVRGSKENTTEAIVENINLISAENYGKDTEEMVTKVRVYGSKIKGLQLLSSSDEDTANTKGIPKNLKVNNESVTTEDQALDLAVSKFNTNREAPTIGTIVSLATPTILPGEKIKIANPTNNIPPQYYTIRSFRHVFKEDDVPQTIFNIEKRKLTVSTLLKNNITFQNEVTINDNPAELDFSNIWDFSTNEGTFNNTERVLTKIAQGTENAEYSLSTISGNTGTWTSPNLVFTPKFIEHLAIGITGENLEGTAPEGTKIQYSTDGGVVFKSLGTDETDIGSNTQVQIRVFLSASATKVHALGIQYSLSD